MPFAALIYIKLPGDKIYLTGSGQSASRSDNPASVGVAVVLQVRNVQFGLAVHERVGIL